MTNNINPVFTKNYYLFRRKFLKIFGASFHVYDKNGSLLFYSKQKAFKLREDIRIYADESMSKELLLIKTPQILDFGATYNVNDPSTGETVGSIRRKFLKSLIKDQWVFLNAAGEEIGQMSESSWLGAILSRFINLIPQTYHIKPLNSEKEDAELKMMFNPFILKYMVSVSVNPIIDRRMIVAAGVLLAAIERRQQ